MQRRKWKRCFFLCVTKQVVNLAAAVSECRLHEEQVVGAVVFRFYELCSAVAYSGINLLVVIKEGRKRVTTFSSFTDHSECGNSSFVSLCRVFLNRDKQTQRDKQR